MRKIDTLKELDTYKRDKLICNFIIKQALSVFSLNRKALMGRTGWYLSSEARMSCYDLIYTNTRLDYNSIGKIFDRTKQLISGEIKRLKRIRENIEGREDYLLRHKELEEKIIKYVAELDKQML